MDYAARRRIWQEIVGSKSGDGIASEVAARFKLTSGQIEGRRLPLPGAWLHLMEKRPPAMKHATKAAGCSRTAGSPGWPGGLSPGTNWRTSSPAGQHGAAQGDKEAYVRHQGTVYGDWGFGKLSHGRGLNILFTGEALERPWL